MTTLTFNELKLFNEILKPDFRIEDFTPQIFYNLTKFQTSYRYVDVLMFAKYVQKLRRSGKFRTHLSNVMGKKLNVEGEKNEIEELTRLSQTVNNFLLCGSFENGFLHPLHSNDDEEITASKRFKNMRLAAAKTENLTSEEQKQKNAFYFYSEMKKRLPTILAKGLNQSYIASMYNTKISGDFENERAKAIEEYNQFLREKRQSIANEVLSYDNFFNILVGSRGVDLISYERRWYIQDGYGRKTSHCFIKKTDAHGNKVWKEAFVGGSTGRPEYSEKLPPYIVLEDIFIGNTTGIEEFPIPMFHNDKFSHFMKSKMTTRHLYVAGDSTLHYEEVTRFLNSKGFKVRTKKAYTDSGIEKTHYNNSDIILGCWHASTKDYKIENLKYSTAFLMNYSIFQVLETSIVTKNPALDPGIVTVSKQMLYSLPTKIRGYCNFLKTLYISETDLEVKTAIEAAIFSVRETYKREYGSYLKAIDTKTEFVGSLFKDEIKTFYELHNEIINDDLYPQGILKATNKIDEMKFNVTKYTARCIGSHCNLAYGEKVNFINRRIDSMKREHNTLSRSWRSVNKAKANTLERHLNAFHREAFDTLSEIYTNPVLNANGVWNAEVRTDEGSLSATLRGLAPARVGGDDTTYPQNAEEFRRMQAGEGIQNDNNVELGEAFREQCHLIHEQKTGEKIEDDKLELETVPLESQVPINPNCTFEMAQEEQRNEDRIKSANIAAIDRMHADERRMLRAEQQAALLAARRAANRPAFINKIIDFFTN